LVQLGALFWGEPLDRELVVERPLDRVVHDHGRLWG
jgi:hypothetical protein